MAVHFIPKEVVLMIHADVLQRYGGATGVRDTGLLHSALAQPTRTFSGKDVHKTLFDKSAAYGFHLCKNHPFVDGNKRVAFVLMDIFLQKNGWEIVSPEDEAYRMMISLASGRLTKAQLASWLQKHSARLADR